jgi:endonuclease/exonuclease/phosphatase family metal-dependent hydrolase
MRTARRAYTSTFFVALVLLAGAGCREFAGSSTGSHGLDGAQPIDAGAEGIEADASGGDAPGADAGDAPRALAVATWNIENFPLDVSTPERVAEIIRSLDLDLLAVQEIASEAAFVLLLDRLDGYDYVLSDHEYDDGTYQKAGVIFRESAMHVVNVSLPFRYEQPECFEENTSLSPFPRPPLEVTFRTDDDEYTFTAVNVHMKAFFPPCDDDCRLRRACANRHLERRVRDRVAHPARTPNILVLGDFNEHLDNGTSDDPFAHWDGDDYFVLTSTLGPDDYSYVHRESLIDHALVTEAMAQAFDADATQVIYLDAEIDGYTDYVSDHLPVIMSFMPAR